jgi:hypothetical protein
LKQDDKYIHTAMRMHQQSRRITSWKATTMFVQQRPTQWSKVLLSTLFFHLNNNNWYQVQGFTIQQHHHHHSSVSSLVQPNSRIGIPVIHTNTAQTAFHHQSLLITHHTQNRYKRSNQLDQLYRYNVVTIKAKQNQKEDDTIEDDTVNDDDESAATTMANKQVKKQKPKFVYVAIGGKRSQIIKVEVIKGNDIIDIKEKIKEKASPDFNSIPAYEVEVFASEEDNEPFDASIEWSPKVSWGTKAQPLIVYTPKPNTTTTTSTTSSINNGE